MIEYLLDIIAFVIGAVIGLKFSYKQHSEPYVVVNKVDATMGLIFCVNLAFILIFFKELKLTAFDREFAITLGFS